MNLTANADLSRSYEQEKKARTERQKEEYVRQQESNKQRYKQQTQEKATLERERLERELRGRIGEAFHEGPTSDAQERATHEANGATHQAVTHQAKGQGEPMDHEPWMFDKQDILNMVLVPPHLPRSRATPARVQSVWCAKPSSLLCFCLWVRVVFLVDVVFVP